MATPLALTSTELVPSFYNNTFQLAFNGVKELTGHEISVQQISLNRSWYNIRSDLNNNTFSYRWIDGTVVTVTMPDGIYDISDINNYMKSVMLANGHVLRDSTSTPATDNYYIQWQVNPVYYKIELTLTVLPAALPGSWGYVSGLSPAWTTSANCPQISLTSLGVNTNSFGSVVGMNTMTNYPTVTTATVQKLSDFVPTVDPVNNLIITCSVANSNSLYTNQLIACMPVANRASSEQIIFEPKNPLWIECQNGVFPNISIRFLDQYTSPLKIQDPYSVTALLQTRKKSTLY